MSVFSRFTDIVNANINALLDKAEDPEKMVRLMIQEMEETLVEVRTTSAKMIADKKELGRRFQWLREEAGEWERKAEVALSKQREDLARAALVEKNGALEEAQSVSAELNSVDQNLGKLSGDIGQLQLKITDAKARQKSLVLRSKTASSQLDVRRTLSRGNVDDALRRFEQFERKMDDIEGQVEAFDLGSGPGSVLADQIAELEDDDQVDAELTRLKQRLNQQSLNRPQAIEK